MTALAALTPLVDMLFPPRCPLCGDPLAAQGGLCVTCWSALAIPGEPCCVRCQRPMGESAPGEGGYTCAPCLADPPRHDGIAAATLYNDASRQLVLQFKHGRKVALGRMLARLILPQLPPLEGEWLIVPVPLHRWRLWHRGYNQAAILAGHLARDLGQIAAPDALARQRRTRSLGGLGRKARARTLQGAIAAHPRWAERLAGAQVLLVDDVMTSGATVEACMVALRRAKVARVRIACFARVLDEAVDDVIGGPGRAGSEKETPGV